MTTDTALQQPPTPEEPSFDRWEADGLRSIAHPPKQVKSEHNRNQARNEEG